MVFLIAAHEKRSNLGNYTVLIVTVWWFFCQAPCVFVFIQWRIQEENDNEVKTSSIILLNI